jgi:hypothetical protein
VFFLEKHCADFRQLLFFGSESQNGKQHILNRKIDKVLTKADAPRGEETRKMQNGTTIFATYFPQNTIVFSMPIFYFVAIILYP